MQRLEAQPAPPAQPSATATSGGGGDDAGLRWGMALFGMALVVGQIGCRLVFQGGWPALAANVELCLCMCAPAPATPKTRRLQLA